MSVTHSRGLLWHLTCIDGSRLVDPNALKQHAHSCTRGQCLRRYQRELAHILVYLVGLGIDIAVR